MDQFPQDQSGPVLVRGARLIDPHAGLDAITDILVSPEAVKIAPDSVPEGTTVVNGEGLWALPGLLDIQVHFRQPGFEYKETIESGSQAAMAGGITGVVVMPNTLPSFISVSRLSPGRWQICLSSFE